MEFFCYHRDRSTSMRLRDELLAEHWSYMDGYASGMIARGPTLADDGDTATGSVHIVDLPDLEAARAFAVEEPYYRASVFRPEVFLRRWRNELGRTMWDFPGGRYGGNRYLVLGHGTGTAAEPVPPDRRSLIAFGPLLSDDGAGWLGTAALVQATDPAAARGVLAPGRYTDVEVHPWQFGGRE